MVMMSIGKDGHYVQVLGKDGHNADIVHTCIKLYVHIRVRTVCVVDKSEASVIVSVLFQPAM